jgi:succinoglycan biosynthesis transport protein ExoP
MLQLNKSLVDISGESAPFEITSATEMLKSLMDFLRRQFPIIVFFALIGIGLGVTYVLTTPPMFTAQTSMIIDTQKAQIFRRPEQSSGNNVIVSAMVDSEVEMLKSENVSLAVIKRFHLADDPEFIGRNGGLLQKLYWSVFDLFGRDVPDSEYERTRRTAAVFANRLTVKRIGLSYVIQVGFESLDPKRAADIADAVANAYIVDQLQAKFQSARVAGSWLRDRLNELREQASTAERAVVEFKVQNNIVSTGGSDKRLVGEQQVAELNSQLVIARAQVSEASARLERIQTVLRADSPNATVDSTVTDTLKDDVIIKLRSQYLTLAEREADWAKRYGSNHLAVVNLRNQMNEIRNSILDELRRIAESYRSDYEIAKQRQTGIERQLTQAVGESQVANRAKVQLTELESNAQSYRTLYDDFLQRYTESVQAQSFPITEARVVTPAARPLTKSHPKTLLALLISASGGMILGLMIGYLRDLTDRAFRTREQVERFLRLDCLATVPKIKVNNKVKGVPSAAPSTKVGISKGVLWRAPSLPPAPSLTVGEQRGELSPAPTSKLSEPKAVPFLNFSHIQSGTAEGDRSSSEVKSGEPPIGPAPAAEMVDKPSNPRTIVRRDELLWQVVDFPLSPYAEAIRSIKMAADLSGARVSKKLRKPKKILGITSSSPSEGKSTIAASLAQLISHSGKRVILVDCDLRAPRLTRVLAPDAKAGLLEVMSGDASLDDVIWTNESKNLSFLPAVATARIPHTAEILSAEEIRLLFDRLRGAYDYIIVDLTPLVPIIDVRATQDLIDQYVFVIEWGRTKVDLVERSLKEATGIYTKILGVVLNKVDNKDLKRYEGYGAYDHDKYYSR